MLSPAVTSPAIPTPVEEIAEALQRIGPLQGLPLEDRLWLARHGQEFVANAGDVLFEEGAPATNMILILKGEIHVRRAAWRADGTVHWPRRPNDRRAAFLAHEELWRPGLRHLARLGAA